MKTKRKNKAQDQKKFVIAGIFIILLIIVVISMMSGLQSKTGVNFSGAIPTPIPQGMQPVAKTASLRLEQQDNSTVNVIIDAGKAPISAAQLQISYDPRILTNVSIQKGSFFSQPIELQNKIDTINGIINYAAGITPTSQSQPGSGVVATIHYIATPGLTNKTHLTFLPATKVTVEGVNQSVLQQPLGIDITVSQN